MRMHAPLLPAILQVTDTAVRTPMEIPSRMLTVDGPPQTVQMHVSVLLDPQTKTETDAQILTETDILTLTARGALHRVLMLIRAMRLNGPIAMAMVTATIHLLLQPETLVLRPTGCPIRTATVAPILTVMVTPTRTRDGLPLQIMRTPLSLMPHNGLMETETDMGTMRLVTTPTHAPQLRAHPHNSAGLAVLTVTAMVTPISMMPSRANQRNGAIPMATDTEMKPVVSKATHVLQHLVHRPVTVSVASIPTVMVPRITTVRGRSVTELTPIQAMQHNGSTVMATDMETTQLEPMVTSVRP